MNLVKLYDNLLIYNILKNDGIVYGETILNNIFNDYLHSDKVDTIRAIVPITYKNIMERDIFQWIITSVELTNKYSTKKKIKYECNYDSNFYNIEIVYVAQNFNSKDVLSSPNLFGLHFDFDLISLSRERISFLFYQNNDRIPIPFLNIMNNILEQKYKILDNVIPTIEVISRIKYLTEIGWINTKSLIEIKDFVNVPELSDDDKCSICLDWMNQEKLVELPCLHYFHYGCWKSHIDKKIEKVENTINCPLCRMEYTLWSVYI